MELKDKQARLAVLMLQAEALQTQIIQLKQEVVTEMNALKIEKEVSK